MVAAEKAILYGFPRRNPSGSIDLAAGIPILKLIELLKQCSLLETVLRSIDLLYTSVLLIDIEADDLPASKSGNIGWACGDPSVHHPLFQHLSSPLTN